MAADRRQADAAHEFRLEGIGLVLGGGFLLAALVGSFLLGRWVERREHPALGTEPGGPGPLAQVLDPSEITEADDGLNYFDDVQGGQKELEPSREAAPRTETAAARTPEPEPRVETAATPTRRTPEPPPAKAAEPARPKATAGDYFVQVFAGRDRRAVEGLVSKLQNAGYGVRILSDREGQGSLFRVRVGGYETKDEATLVAMNLKKQGYPDAWVASP